MAKVACVFVTLFAICTSDAGASDQRAQINYMMHCQGCHLPKAMGYPGKVPRMNGFLGYFLHSSEGREFIIRVPGVATSSLPDDQLAELMNWLLWTYSAAQLPKEFEPLTVDEVALLRRNPEGDPEATRKLILKRISVDTPALAQKFDTENFQ